MKSKSKKISVIINTKNCEKTLEKTLKSIRGLGDEIVIVDMHSVDKTVQIAKKYTDKIFSFKDCGYADPARNFAFSKAKYDWIFIIDSDETITQTMKKTIDNIVAGKMLKKMIGDCYFFPRKNFIFKKFITHTNWYPDYQLRLFKKNKVIWNDGVHSFPKVLGKKIYLPAKDSLSFRHLNYQTIDEFVAKLNRYTNFQADEIYKNDKNQVINSEKIFSSFFDEFFNRYFLNYGYKDEAHGLSLSFLQSMAQLVAFLKVWQKQNFKSYTFDEKEAINNFLSLKKTINYWVATYNIENSRGLKKIYWQLKRKLKI